MSKTPDFKWPEELRDIGAVTETTIAASLTDPDLAAMSADYRAGYARGFREATLAFVMERFKKSVR